jgi:hypothetical protein
MRHTGIHWSRFDTKTPSSCMAVALMTATDSHERMRLGTMLDTMQHLPTFASRPLHKRTTLHRAHGRIRSDHAMGLLHLWKVLPP